MHAASYRLIFFETAPTFSSKPIIHANFLQPWQKKIKKKKLAESSKLRGWYCSGEKQPNTHTVDSVHEPINHNTVLVINTNCPLKYNRPANKATLWPPLVFALKALVARCRNIPS